ncbi:hypothetical protein [Streptomyces sp. RFCAC02]|nr:hypothetical protein [Streptomyces sp. RFCAC02]
MGAHSKPEPDLSQGTPPPGNSDSRVETPSTGNGTHKKDDGKKDEK